MLFETLGIFVGYFVGKGKRGTRMWKMLGIILAMSFFLGLIGGFISQFIYDEIITSLINWIILPLPVNLIIVPKMFYGVEIVIKVFYTALFSMMFTFIYWLIGRFVKWLTSRRGL